MCILKKYLGIHLTQHDKLDLLFVGITLGDLLWLIGDASRDFQHYHLLVGLILGLCTVYGCKLLYCLCMRHHRKWVKKHTKVVELQTIKHSEK